MNPDVDALLESADEDPEEIDCESLENLDDSPDFPQKEAMKHLKRSQGAGDYKSHTYIGDHNGYLPTFAVVTEEGEIYAIGINNEQSMKSNSDIQDAFREELEEVKEGFGEDYIIAY